VPDSRMAAAHAARWRNKTPEDRRRETSAARRALAVKELVDQAPELTEEQRARLRALLQPPERAS
jgi:hypothetical protein